MIATVITLIFYLLICLLLSIIIEPSIIKVIYYFILNIYYKIKKNPISYLLERVKWFLLVSCIYYFYVFLFYSVQDLHYVNISCQFIILKLLQWDKVIPSRVDAVGANPNASEEYLICKLKESTQYYEFLADWQFNLTSRDIVAAKWFLEDFISWGNQYVIADIHPRSRALAAIPVSKIPFYIT